MVRHLARSLAVWLAFAAALLLPARARAAFLPACDAREHASLMTPPPAPVVRAEGPQSSCDGVLPADEGAPPSTVAAICDPRGASAIAPPRILPVADSRIEAAPCPGAADGSATAIGPGPRGPSAVSAPALAGNAVLSAVPEVLPAFFTLAPPYPTEVGMGHAGVRHAVDHVPRP